MGPLPELSLYAEAAQGRGCREPEEAGAAVARGLPKDVPGLLRAAVASQPGGLLQRLAQEGLRQHGQVYPDHQGRVRAPVQAAPWDAPANLCGQSVRTRPGAPRMPMSMSLASATLIS